MNKKINDIPPEAWDKLRNFEGDWGKQVEEFVNAIESTVPSDDTHSSDMVERPPHYNQGAIEAINYIRQQLGTGFVEYCQGNVIKYLHRWKYKNGLEDLEKARWYLQRMIEEVE